MLKRMRLRRKEQEKLRVRVQREKLEEKQDEIKGWNKMEEMEEKLKIEK